MLLDGMEKKLNPLIYGAELFSNSSAGFAENQNIAICFFSKKFITNRRINPLNQQKGPF
jgi:hypothetical protein